jgi:hypothetical protein
MESQHTVQKTPTSSQDSLHEDAPLLNLLGTPIDQLSPEELRERVTQLREITSSPNTLKKSLTNKKQEEKSTVQTKVSAAELTNKYLKLGQS